MSCYEIQSILQHFLKDSNSQFYNGEWPITVLGTLVPIQPCLPWVRQRGSVHSDWLQENVQHRIGRFNPCHNNNHYHYCYYSYNYYGEQQFCQNSFRTKCQKHYQIILTYFCYRIANLVKNARIVQRMLNILKVNLKHNCLTIKKHKCNTFKGF